MPGFDGTGPRGEGPLTGRGEGYCTVAFPESGGAPYGYAGLQGRPVQLGTPVGQPALGTRFARWPRRLAWAGRPRGRGRGRGLRRGMGRRFGRW